MFFCSIKKPLSLANLVGHPSLRLCQALSEMIAKRDTMAEGLARMSE
jgi:hypothetical protein